MGSPYIFNVSYSSALLYLGKMLQETNKSKNTLSHILIWHFLMMLCCVKGEKKEGERSKWLYQDVSQTAMVTQNYSHLVMFFIN